MRNRVGYDDIDARAGWVTTSVRVLSGPAARDVAASLGVTYVAVAWVLKIWRIHPHRIFLLNGDSIWYAAHIKGFLPDTNHWSNPMLGSPFGQNMADFPLGANNLNWAIIRLFGWVNSDWALVYNLFYLSTFGLAAATAVLVLRRWSVSRPIAIAMAVLFATSPYHFLRGEFHVFLAAYWMVPVGCHIALRHFDELPFLDIRKSSIGPLLRRRRTWLIIASALALGSTGPYYALWSAMIIVVAGALAAHRHASLRHLLSALTITGIIAATLTINLAPTFISSATRGSNPAAVGRDPSEADVFGLRIVNLFSPVRGHRVDFVKEAFDSFGNTPIPSEGSDHLGLVAALGLTGAIIAAMGTTVARSDDDPTAARIGALSLFFMITSSIAGLSWFVRAAGLPELRAWNRISILLSFLSLLAAGLTLTKLALRLSTSEGSHKFRNLLVPTAMAAVLVLVGVFDQTTPNMVPDYERGASTMNEQIAFWKPIEQQLGSGADVFQFPVVPFPENPQVSNQKFYEHLLPYLATDRLRFSSGGMKGREAEWQEVLDRDDPDLTIGLLQVGGFDAVTVDRFGYDDRGQRIEALLTSKLGPPRWVSPDNRQVVYDMRAYNGGSLIDPAPEFETDARLASAMQITYLSGQWAPERSRDVPSRWLRPRATIKIDNPTDSLVSVSLRSELDMVSPGRLRIADSVTGSEIAVIDIPESQTPLDLSLDIPPGGRTLDFISTAPLQTAPGDSRALGVYLTEPLVLPEPLESLATN